ncbi:hypothetical protein [Pseudoalteromonas sp. T1lg23B]|uniref:hypothetical protein n=1 Tax=Pseudoalteromonas sp. T1lg23B TaxID=2077097 RepID=UPI000CF604E3|nr:hypothetical protein [Pseudoalteromonas sp. T1lg23B]
MIAPEIQLLIKEKADTARNQAIGALAFVVLIVTLLTSLGIYQFVVEHTEDSVKKALKEQTIAKIIERLKTSDQEALKIVEKLRKKEQELSSYIGGIHIDLEDIQVSSWQSKFKLHQTYLCPDDRVMVGLDFKHEHGQNLTFQEQYRAHCAKLTVTAK